MASEERAGGETVSRPGCHLAVRGSTLRRSTLVPELFDIHNPSRIMNVRWQPGVVPLHHNQKPLERAVFDLRYAPAGLVASVSRNAISFPLRLIVSVIVSPTVY